MKANKKFYEIGDFGGFMYSFFLHLMMFSQMGFFIMNIFDGDVFYCFLHLLGMCYFLFRLHMLGKIKEKALEAGLTLLEYLRGKYMN